MVNAEQASPVLSRPNGDQKSVRLDTGGPSIGLLPGEQYDEETVAFNPDGVSESMNEAGDEWGEKSIVAEMAVSGMKPADLLAAHLVDEADKFAAGAPQHDDMTVVVLRAV